MASSQMLTYAHRTMLSLRMNTRRNTHWHTMLEMEASRPLCARIATTTTATQAVMACNKSKGMRSHLLGGEQERSPRRGLLVHGAVAANESSALPLVCSTSCGAKRETLFPAAVACAAAWKALLSTIPQQCHLPMTTHSTCSGSQYCLLPSCMQSGANFGPSASGAPQGSC